MKAVPIPGVVAVFTDNEGRVIATATSFEPESFSGFSLLRSQEIRAGNRLNAEVLKSYCSDIVSEVLNAHECRDIVNKMVKRGSSITLIPVGHPTAPSPEGEERS